MYYCLLIHGSLSDGTYSWINPYKYRNPFITSRIVLFRSKERQLVFHVRHQRKDNSFFMSDKR